MWRELRSTTSSLQIGLEIGSNCQQRNECPYLFFFFFHLYWKFSTQIWRIASSHASIMVGCALSSPYGSRVLINLNRPSQLQLTRPIHLTICTQHRLPFIIIIIRENDQKSPPRLLLSCLAKLFTSPSYFITHHKLLWYYNIKKFDTLSWQ